MAELTPQQARQLNAAAAAITLTTSRRLIRNFRYYRSQKQVTVYREELITLLQEIRKNTFSLHNLLSIREPGSAFCVSLAGEIHHQIEEFHRLLLFFDADQIAEIVPFTDEQRRFWKNLTETEFYGDQLLEKLESDLPELLYKLEKKLFNLPESVDL